jgi:hypothetical protein
MIKMQTMKGATWVLLASVPAFAHRSFGPVSGNFFGLAGINETYDYIVVGGGTAGLAVAYRLSEDVSKTVAVIEGGGFSDM